MSVFIQYTQPALTAKTLLEKLDGVEDSMHVALGNLHFTCAEIQEGIDALSFDFEPMNDPFVCLKPGGKNIITVGELRERLKKAIPDSEIRYDADKGYDCIAHFASVHKNNPEDEGYFNIS